MIILTETQAVRWLRLNAPADATVISSSSGDNEHHFVRVRYMNGPRDGFDGATLPLAVLNAMARIQLEWDSNPEKLHPFMRRPISVSELGE